MSSRKAGKDEFGMPVNIKIYPARNFCCEKHETEASTARKCFFEMRYNSNIVELQNILLRVAAANNYFLARETLKVVAELQLKKNGHLKGMSQEQMYLFLDACIMTDANQLRRQEWSNERERRENLGAIPVSIYDGREYVYRLAAILKELDTQLM